MTKSICFAIADPHIRNPHRRFRLASLAKLAAAGFEAPVDFSHLMLTKNALSGHNLVYVEVFGYMFSRLSNRTLLGLSLSTYFLFSVGCVQAQETLNLKMDKAEQLLLGKSASGEPLESRLDAIEMNLYGKTKHGSVEKRMEGISDFLGIKDAGKSSPSADSSTSAQTPESQSQPAAQSATPTTTDPKSLKAATSDPKSLKAATTDPKSISPKAAVKVPVKTPLAPLKAEEALMAVPPVAPKHQDVQMPPAAPPIATTMNRSNNGWNSQARDLLREGLRLHSNGQYRQAEQTFRQVLTVDPRNADAFYNLGSLAERNHDYVIALTNYRAALNFNPQDKDYIQAVNSMENQLSIATPQSSTVGNFQVPNFAATTGVVGESPTPFQLSGTQNDVLLNVNQNNDGIPPSLSVSQNNPPPMIGVSQRPKGHGPFGAIMNVGLRAGMSYGLRGTGLHCPMCRLMGSGFHF